MSRRFSRCALAAACLAVLAAVPSAHAVRPPAVPAEIAPPAGHEAFRIDHAVGTQNYVCVEKTSAFEWAFFGPQATLLSREDRQTATHFLAINPDEDEQVTLRAAWQDSRDSSTVWAKAIKELPAPQTMQSAGTINWLLLEVVGSERGPNGGRRLAATKYIQRIETVGGKAPETGCAEASDVGKKALVPYQAHYVFYREARR